MPNENVKKTVLWITRTAVFVAILIVFQLATSGVQFLTGSLVNLVLTAAALTAGLGSGLAVALISPVLAKLIGIGPLWQLVPVIMLGNAALVAVYSLLFKKGKVYEGAKKYALWAVAVPAAAFLKFLVLFFGVNKVAVPLLGDTVPAAMASKLAVMFSWIQLFTALAGGALAMLVVPLVQRALKKK